MQMVRFERLPLLLVLKVQWLRYSSEIILRIFKLFISNDSNEIFSWVHNMRCELRISYLSSLISLIIFITIICVNSVQRVYDIILSSSQLYRIPSFTVCYHSYKWKIDWYGFGFYKMTKWKIWYWMSAICITIGLRNISMYCKIEWVPDQRFHLKLVIITNEHNRSDVKFIHEGIPHQSSK